MSDTADRSHAASPRQRERAREQGYVPRSREFTFALVYASIAVTVVTFGPSLWQLMASSIRNDLLAARDPSQDPLAHLRLWIAQGLWWISPWLLAASIAAALGHWLQHGPLWLPKQVRWTFDRVSPANGWHRLLRPANIVGVMFAATKMAILGVLACWLIRSNWNALQDLSLADAEHLGPRAALLLTRCGAWVGVALLIWGAVDFAWQLFCHERGLRMSPDELREEVQSVQNDVARPRRRR